jgi:predicted aspartyl protease
MIKGFIAKVLYDFGATHSFISNDFAEKLDIESVDLGYELAVHTPTGSIVTQGRVLCDVPIQMD